MRKSLSFLALVALSVTGCTTAVEITQPATSAPPTPVTEFRVKFAPYFAPGTFRAELDGQDITSGFVPAAAKGGTARLQLPDTGEGFIDGLWLGTSASPERLPELRLPSHIHFPPGSAGSTPGGGSGSGKPIPNITMFGHKLAVSGQCNGVICDTTDELYFFPLHLVPIPTAPLTLRVGRSAVMELETYPENTEDVEVQITPSSVSVRLDDKAPGVPTKVTTPAKGRSKRFTVTGMVSGKLLLFLDARGTQRGSISGLVNP